MVPDRVAEAIEMHELRPGPALVLLWLMIRGRTTGQVRITLRALAETVGWKQTNDTLLRALKGLREAGWIDFDTKQGQQLPYRITLVGAAVERQLPQAAVTDFAEAATTVPKSMRKHKARASGTVEPNAADSRGNDAEADAEALEREERERQLSLSSNGSGEAAAAPLPLAALAPPPPAIVDECMRCMEKLPVRTRDRGRTYYCDGCAPLAGGAHA